MTRGGWGAGLALALTACGPLFQASLNGVPLTGAPASQAPASQAPSAPTAAPERVTPEQVAVRQQAGEAFVVVDVRSAAAYTQEHIEGAVHAAWADISQGRASLPRDKTLLLYCT
ncbi:MAG: rhodanese-like domain-containing protein [Candidatus Sericytochromatia bacterium]|nr:rhodanese-like domain-containing protein [Candidatus Sericytochromatia bacterium]